MRVLIACEFSGRVRDAFIKKGHDAWSCDLLPTESPGPHIEGNVLEVLNDGWDLMIAHPPCTHLACSGAVWFPEKIADGRQQQAIDFFLDLAYANINKICIENPVGIMSTHFRLPDQTIQPYEYGNPHRKRTCLWLKNLPLLRPTKIVEPELITLKNGKTMDRTYACLWSSPDRGKLRSVTYSGIAEAMASQWGNIRTLYDNFNIPVCVPNL